MSFTAAELAEMAAADAEAANTTVHPVDCKRKLRYDVSHGSVHLYMCVQSVLAVHFDFNHFCYHPNYFHVCLRHLVAI